MAYINYNFNCNSYSYNKDSHLCYNLLISMNNQLLKKEKINEDNFVNFCKQIIYF